MRGGFMKVYPLLVGELEAHEGDVFRGGNPAIKVPFPCYSFYIEGASRPILVDTGFGDPEFCKKHLDASEGFILKVAPGMSLKDHLSRLGVGPESIEVIVLTHCHWDHIGALDLFPNATVYVQRKEISWAVFPQHWMQRSYLPVYARNLTSLGDRLILQEGDAVIEKGITTKFIGGHSPGCQVVEVEAGKGKVIIVGDLLMKYSNIEKQIPIGSFHSIEISDRFLQSLRGQLMENPDTVVLPGHDQKVWDNYKNGI